MTRAALCDVPFREGTVGSAVRFESLWASLSNVCAVTVTCTEPLEGRFAGFAEGRPYALIDGNALDRISRPPAAGASVAERREAIQRSIAHPATTSR